MTIKIQTAAESARIATASNYPHEQQLAFIMETVKQAANMGKFNCRTYCAVSSAKYVNEMLKEAGYLTSDPEATTEGTVAFTVYWGQE